MVDGAAAADTAAAATEEECEARLVARISAAVAEQTAAVVLRLQREVEVLTENADRTDLPLRSQVAVKLTRTFQRNDLMVRPQMPPPQPLLADLHRLQQRGQLPVERD